MSLAGEKANSWSKEDSRERRNGSRMDEEDERETREWRFSLRALRDGWRMM